MVKKNPKIHLISLHSGLQCHPTSKHNFSKFPLQFSTKTLFPCMLCWDQCVGWELGGVGGGEGEGGPQLSPLPALPTPHTSHVRLFPRGCWVWLLTCELLACRLGHRASADPCQPALSLISLFLKTWKKWHSVQGRNVKERLQRYEQSKENVNLYLPLLNPSREKLCPLTQQLPA